jgi:AAA domain-containing protein
MSSPLDGLTTATVHLLAKGTVARIFGPPGTGKSTRLKDIIRDLVLDHGPESVLVTSFTVTAARSIAKMGLPIPDRQVGTLHSMAYRSVGDFCEVALEGKILADWNAQVGLGWKLTPAASRSFEAASEGGGGVTEGDALLNAYDLARAQLIPQDALPAEVQAFALAWEGWKRRMEAVDFTDMIRIALERAVDGEPPPGRPRVLIADEAQDMTPLEIALVLAWGANCEQTILALDDDQAIMNWRGGNCDPILDLGSDAGQTDVELRDTYLEQSWRIPAAVHTVAQTWIENSSHRQDKNYHSRDADGQIYAVSLGLEDMRTAEQIAKDAHAGREVMVLAACEYMLRPVIANLRKIGVPFANHYRPKESRWNPMGGARGMTSAERLFRYLVPDERVLGKRSRLWTGDDVRAWIDLLDSRSETAGLAKGAKSSVKMLPAGTLDIAQVEALFASETAIEAATEPDLSWFMRSVLPSKLERLRYPEAVARAHGAAALVDPPLVTVGTIHSVKGGQVGHPIKDGQPARGGVVYLSPSLSPAGLNEWAQHGRMRDNVIRQFYVGLTRTYTTCVIMAPMDRRCCVPRALLCPPEMMVR